MLEVGDEIRGYRIERLLGRGGMGEVYEATQLALGRRVAFKVLHTGLGDDEEFRERFRREGRLQAALDHPNVVAVHEAGEIDDGLFLAMRLVDGSTLKQSIVAGELDARRALRILGPVADALDAAHAAGLVHRDVKPQNILVGKGDHPYLADFGLTRGEDQSGVTRSGQFLGTIDYISPEQVRGEPAGPASDVYALGAVLHECLTGSVPFPRPSDAAVLYAQVNDSPPAATASRDDLPATIDAVLARALAKEPDDRPASASELVAAAAAALGDDPAVAASRPPARDALAHGVRAVAGDTADAELPGGEETAGATPATVAASAARRRGVGRWLAAAIALVALAAVGFAGGRALGGDGAGELTTSVSSAALSLSAPAGWEATAPAERPAIPGLRLSDAIGATPAARDGSGIMAGMTAATGPTLLPATLAERTPARLPAPDAVALGELEALRYVGVTLEGFDRDLTLYAAPSTGGTATVACYAPEATATEARTCEEVAQTLELTAGDPLPLATPPATERVLERTLRQLDRSRAAARRRLARADDAAAQARAATALRRAYRDAARQLNAIDAGPLLAAATAATADAASAAATAYGRLATAATTGDRAGYAAARDDVTAAERRVGRATAALERASAPSGADL